MKSYKIILTQILIFGVSIILFAQPDNNGKLKFINGYSLINWQSEDGLPQNSVLAVFQDKDGYLWCGTLHGLVRFDGYSFTSVLDNSHIISSGITSIIQTDDGSLWMGTFGSGIIILKNGILKAFQGNSQLKNKYITSLAKTDNGGIITCSDKEIRIFYKDSSRSLSSELSLREQLFRIQCVDKYGKIWIIGNQDGLFSFKDNKLVYESSLNKKFQNIGYFYWLSDSAYIVFDNGKLIKYNPNNHKNVLISGTKKLDVRQITKDNDDNLWIAGNNNALFQVRGDSLIKFPAGDGVIYNLLVTVLCDRENNIWLGSLEGGLTKITRGFLKTVSEIDGLSNEFVFTIVEDKKGVLYLGTYGGGLFTYDGKKVKNIDYSKGYNSSGIIRSLVFDKSGKLYIGTYGDGLFIGNHGKFIQYTKKDGLSNDFIYAQVFDKEGNLWIGTAEGLVKYDGQTFHKIKLGSGLDTIFIRALEFDNSGALWIGTDRNGLVYFKNGLVKRISSAEGLPSEYIRSIFIDKDDAAWVCSSEGLTYIKGEKLKNITTKVSVLDNLLYQVIEDNSQNLWLTSNKGIIRILREDINKFIAGQLNEIPFTIFDRQDGMLSSECIGGNTPAGIKLRSGKIAIPTLKGLVLIDPHDVPVSSIFPNIVFESVFADEYNYPPEKNISIPPGNKRIEINFNSPTFRDPRKIRFRYRLKELDDDWINLDNSRKIVFNRLRAGDYTLELTCTNQLGRWNPVPARLLITIEPYFYETKPFYFIVFLILIIVGSTIYFYRVSKLEKQKIELEKIIQEKTRSLKIEKEKTESALNEANRAKELLSEKNEELIEANRQKSNLIDIAVHDLKNPLHVIRGFSQILLEKTSEIKELEAIVNHIRKSTDIMLEIINNLLKSSVIESGKIELKLTEFEAPELVIEIIYRHKSHAVEKNQQIIYTGPQKGIIYNDRERIGEILDNLISNAVKYSPIGKCIEVGFFPKEHGYVFFVKDEGPGFTEDDKKRVFGKFQRLSARPTGNEHSTGLGLSIVRDLVKLTGGNVLLESEKGKGALFTVEYTTT